jgi:hypothetical protein
MGAAGIHQLPLVARGGSPCGAEGDGDGAYPLTPSLQGGGIGMRRPNSSAPTYSPSLQGGGTGMRRPNSSAPTYSPSLQGGG